MNPLFQDRITGVDAEALSSGQAVLPGRWQVLVDAEGVRLNGMHVTKRASVVEDRSGRWRLTAHDATMQGDVVGGVLVDEDEALTYRLIAARLGDPHEARDWFHWYQASPLELGLERHLHLNSIETELEKALPYLEHICASPYTLLRHDSERLPVGRVRRMANDATRHLAAHTRDWDRRTFRGVHPRYLRARILDEEWDTYENRLVGRLIDRLSQGLAQRLHQLRKRQQAIEAARDLTQDVADGSHWRRARLTTLWGEAFARSGDEAALGDLIERLQRLQQRLVSLKGSPLYKNLPPGANVTAELKRTNVLSNDLRYRRAAELWRTAGQLQQDVTKDPEEHQQRVQDLHDDFARFCTLLVIRALRDLGWDPQDPERLLGPGSTHVLTRRDRNIEVRLEVGGTCVLTQEEANRRALRVVPMAVDLLALPNESAVASLVTDLENAVPKGITPHTLLLLPLTDLTRWRGITRSLQRRLHHLGGDPTEASNFDVTLISPLQLTATERIARSLRWWLTADEFLAFPPQVPDLESSSRKDTRQAATALLPVRSWRRRVEKDLDGLRQSHGSLEVRVARQTSPKQRSMLRREANRTEEKLIALEQRHRNLEDAERRLRNLYTCPVCDRESLLDDVKVGSDRTFSCDCRGCKARWGVQICGRCGERYPFLLPNVDVPAETEDPTWIDRSFGRDVLTVPRPLGSKLAFHCATCNDLTP